ncbi:hypothetical protein HEP73_00612 [Xanthomonas sp. GW]|uniref:hypothetical protein n=1 Tax=Xanthomonas sp. GW TaxID=2724121 RepID=UPI0016395C5A|nr:hypothetical protein [Xanthomonas sp. GW]QNH19714.1 hypothetical protein HEP73_00612 [Xanthomonas sp. GW]
MAKTEDSKEGSKNSGLSHLSLMDKAWDSQWVMRFSCIVLFVDAALVLKGGKGLLQWSATTEKLWQDVGFLIVAAAAFGLLASFVLPTLAYFVRWLVLLFPGVASFDDSGRLPGCVSAGDFRDYALKRESEFLLRMYDEAWREWLRHRSERDEMGNLVFVTVVMAIADGMLALLYLDGRSLVHDALVQLGDGAWLLVPLLLTGAFLLLSKTWFAADRPVVIYYPPLYWEQREKQLRDRGNV